MKKQLVSTITPCYKMEKYLPKFLELLPQQTYFDNIEIVLDHNEPTKEEIRLVKQFQKKYPGRLKHIIVKKVDPIGISMNRCIKKASGNFLTIWNVDDLRTEDSIELQATELINDSKTDIVYGDYYVVNKFGKFLGKKLSHKKYKESELTRSMILGPFFMFRKELCKKAGLFDEQLRSGADFDFAIRLAFNGTAKMIKNPLGYYLNEGLGASTRPGSLQALERTVIELRYGIYDKIDYSYLPKAIRYNIYNVLIDNKQIPIKNYVTDYENIISNRYNLWFEKGLKKHINLFNKIKRTINPKLRYIKHFAV